MAPTNTPPTPINLRDPSRYIPANKTVIFTPPPHEWLHRTWCVSHSTLSMWRSARNVRITYKPLEPTTKDDPPRERVDDLVEYESLSGKGGVKSVAGVDTAVSAADSSVWTWRGKGWMFFLSSHWEILGWGERTLEDGRIERWLVTWFAATTFTKEGLDILSDRKEGTSEGTVKEVLAALQRLEAKPVAELCAKDMLPVAISVPWKER